MLLSEIAVLKLHVLNLWPLGYLCNMAIVMCIHIPPYIQPLPLTRLNFDPTAKPPCMDRRDRAQTDVHPRGDKQLVGVRLDPQLAELVSAPGPEFVLGGE